MDSEIASKLRINNRLHTEISQFAAQRSQNEEVKQFAQTVNRGHSEMIAKLPQPTSSAGRSGYDVSSTLREIAQRLESGADSRREVLGFRGSAGPDVAAQPGQAVEPGRAAQLRSDAEKRRAELRKIIDQQRAVIRDAREDSQEDREEDREDRQEARQEDREDREDRPAGANQEVSDDRGQESDDSGQEDVAASEARQKLREARRELRELREDTREQGQDRLTRLWTRAPEILNAVAQTVDEMGVKSPQGSFGDYERKVVERLAATIKKELEQKTGKAFDQAYLGYEILCHLSTLDTMEVAKQYCSPEMCSALDESISMTQGHLQQARDLMEKIGKEGT
jgi:predicted outer membrane protein